jgi:hypothetical protein
MWIFPVADIGTGYANVGSSVVLLLKRKKCKSKNSNMIFGNDSLGLPISRNSVDGYTVYAVELYKNLVLTVM